MKRITVLRIAAIGIIGLSGSVSADTSLHTFTAGTVISSQEVNENFDVLEQFKTETIKTNIPVGGIIAWHKSLTGTSALPENWVECNGSVINDSESPLHGQAVPNLNGDGRFLRGGSISGIEQEDEFKSHTHDLTSVNVDSGSGNTGFDYSSTDQANYTRTTAAAGGDETRPINMSVVWIMRIK